MSTQRCIPDFAKIAKEEGKKEIARLLTAISKLEVEHEREYLELKKVLDEEGFLRVIMKNFGYVKHADTFTEAKKHLKPVHCAKLHESILRENFWHNGVLTSF